MRPVDEFKKFQQIVENKMDSFRTQELKEHEGSREIFEKNKENLENTLTKALGRKVEFKEISYFNPHGGDYSISFSSSPDDIGIFKHVFNHVGVRIDFKENKEDRVYVGRVLITWEYIYGKGDAAVADFMITLTFDGNVNVAKKVAG